MRIWGGTRCRIFLSLLRKPGCNAGLFRWLDSEPPPPGLKSALPPLSPGSMFEGSRNRELLHFEQGRGVVKQSPESELQEFYRRLFAAWGPQHWWPAQSRFEVIAGAYLTQNTAWTNVQRALANLRAAGALSLEGVRRLPLRRLEELIRPAGYFRQKARRLKVFIDYLDERYQGRLERMFSQPTQQLREELLGLNGVGPETADSILLYAGGHAVFVVDAYTRRVLARHGLASEDAHYEELRALCERALGTPAFMAEYESWKQMPALKSCGPAGSCHLPSRMSRKQRSPRAQIFNEMHGLLVGVAKNYCLKAEARCELCPLRELLRTAV
jgi:endonuclease-3 related protein